MDIFLYLKNEIKFQCSWKKKLQCSKLRFTFFLRRNGNFICENLRIHTFYNCILILVDTLHELLLKVLFLRASNMSEKSYVPVFLTMGHIS